MSCSICGASGHNARTCPIKQKAEAPPDRGHDRMVIAIDNSSEEKLHEIAAAVMKAKREIDSNARGTIVIGDEKKCHTRFLIYLRIFPRISRMNKSHRPYAHIKAQKEVKEMEGYMCIFCGGIYNDAHGHHLLPYSEGGPATIHAMTTACIACHQRYHAGRSGPDIIRF